MGTFSDTRRRLTEYRICLEFDVGAGIIQAPAAVSIDACYASLYVLLETARVELEAAGPEAHDAAFVNMFVDRCAALGRRMFRAMYRQRNVLELERTAADVRSKARVLMEHLRARVERAA